VDVRCRDASERPDDRFDAILVNAGLTHAPDSWLDAVEPGGRIVLPLTSTIPAMGSNVGKGLVLLLTKRDTGNFEARTIGFVAIYSAVGLRDADLNEQVGKALAGGPVRWQGITHLRRDAHEPEAACWLHGRGFCLGTGAGA
jgi:protein-L-isoaspartate(D-aspartate) O-methyltransferase